MGKAYVELTTQEAVEELMRPGGGTGVIDFWAPWCGPCRGFAPVFEEVARGWEDQGVRFFKLDTQAHPELAQAFNIRSIPTLVFVHDGEIVDVKIGASGKAAFEEAVAVLASKARGEGFWHRLMGKHRRKEGS